MFAGNRICLNEGACLSYRGGAWGRFCSVDADIIFDGTERAPTCWSVNAPTMSRSVAVSRIGELYSLCRAEGFCYFRLGIELGSQGGFIIGSADCCCSPFGICILIFLASSSFLLPGVDCDGQLPPTAPLPSPASPPLAAPLPPPAPQTQVVPLLPPATLLSATPLSPPAPLPPVVPMRGRRVAEPRGRLGALAE